VRDILNVADAVEAYIQAWRRIDQVRGRAFNLGGGPSNAVSLVQLIGHIEELAGRKIDLGFSEWRPGDQRYYVSDPSAAHRELSLPPPLAWRTGVAQLAQWLAGERSARKAPRERAAALS
jgi:CDP-paratose 2-epimerase